MRLEHIGVSNFYSKSGTSCQVLEFHKKHSIHQHENYLIAIYFSLTNSYAHILVNIRKHAVLYCLLGHCALPSYILTNPCRIGEPRWYMGVSVVHKHKTLVTACNVFAKTMASSAVCPSTSVWSACLKSCTMLAFEPLWDHLWEEETPI